MSSHRKTKKQSPSNPTIGWRVVRIYGDPYDRGYQHGELLYKELKRVFFVLPFLIEKTFNITIDKYYDVCKDKISMTVQKHFPEIYQEIRGICDGAAKKGVKFSINQLIAWNSYSSMYEYLLPVKSNHYIQRCSAFIATGTATENGDIVMAHNSHCDFIHGSMFHVVMYVFPSQGFPFVMQTCPGYVCSDSDFFITSSGIVGCETTISKAKYIPEFKGNYPYFCRIRECMQYGSSLDDYARIMTTKNAGDYPCSWLFGNIHTNEIMLCELGLKITNIKRTKNGIFYGMNSAIDRTLRLKETDDKDHYNLNSSVGARNKRFRNLLYKTYYGKLNCQIAKRVLADHYDEHSKKVNPSNRSLCNHHYESEIANRPHAAQDGKVVDSVLARKMQFWGIFGSSCGKAFSVKNYIDKNPMNREWKPYLANYAKGKWVLIQDCPASYL
jgi:hypothetical protein